MANKPLTALLGRLPAFGQWLLWLALGTLAGLTVTLGLQTRPAIGLAAAAVLLLLPVLLTKPRFMVWIGLLCIFVLEEFPSGQGETVERSTRMPFYGTSLGIPGMYGTDVVVFGLICVYLLSTLIRKKLLIVPIDGISLGLVAASGMAVLSVLLSFIGGDPLAHASLQESTGTAFEINDQAIKLIAFFQYKNYAFLFISYVLGILLVQRPEDCRELLRIVGVGIFITVVIGLYRLLRHPEWVAQTIPVFYDSPSVWLFSMTIFYTVAAWAFGLLTPRKTAWMTLLSGVMGVFILVSFRRTMWGGILLCALPLFLLIPGRARQRLLVVGTLAGTLVLGAVALSPVGAALLDRVHQTSVADLSTLYRLAILTYVIKHFGQIPFFGYGAKPLWNEFTNIGYFRTNVENVHSLYYWLLLRTGVAGLMVFITAMGVMLYKALTLARKALNPQYRVIAIVLLLAIALFLFSGIFNPVYAETRYTIVLGLCLALLSRLCQFDLQERRKGAAYGHHP